MTDQQPTNEKKKEEHKLIALRREKLATLRKQGTAFPNHFQPQNKAALLQKKYLDQSKAELSASNIEASVAGRIMLNRGSFLEIQDGSGRIQLYINRKNLSPENLKSIKTWDLGDIVGVTGRLQRSGKGDLYIDITTSYLLTKTLRGLPEKHKGLVDTEMRYRQRYVDLMVNKKSQDTFRIRAQIINGIRHYLTAQDYMEVETPMLHPIPGGATARPFVTHHNALDMDMYLRIAPELYLKRLVVGGYERVYEINRNFRNEGLSTRHNPEFTMLEFYQAYATYQDMMDHSEAMLKYLAEDVMKTSVIHYQGHDIDFSRPFSRMTVIESIIHFNPALKIHNLNCIHALKEIANDLGVALQTHWGIGKIQWEIFEKTVEHRLMMPTFIMDHPIEVSPLARCKEGTPEIAERFELFIAGREIANGFSELNDPEDQAARFRHQALAKEAGDDEAMHFDHDYITALEYGLPPTAGEGIGIDRLVMLFADAPSIRDVLFFPHMRNVNKEE